MAEMRPTLIALLALGMRLLVAGADKKKPGTPIWQFETGAEVSASPAIGSDGTVYVGERTLLSSKRANRDKSFDISHNLSVRER